MAPLNLDDIIQGKEGEELSVRDALMALHPTGKPIQDDALLHNCLPNALPFDPIIFEAINGSLIRSTALHWRGSAGLSGANAHAWHRCVHHSRKLPPMTAMSLRQFQEDCALVRLPLLVLMPFLCANLSLKQEPWSVSHYHQGGYPLHHFQGNSVSGSKKRHALR